MPITEHTDTEPGQLPGDLRQLRRLSWSEVLDWLSESDVTFEHRLADVGWELVAADPVLSLRLPSGAVYDLDDYDSSLTHWVCRATAFTVDDNAELFLWAERAWQQYFSAAVQELGVPDRDSRWDDTTFAPLYHWTSDEVRLRERTPFRLASWHLGGTRMLLWVNVLAGTSTNRRPGTVAIIVTLTPPEGG